MTWYCDGINIESMGPDGGDEESPDLQTASRLRGGAGRGGIRHGHGHSLSGYEAGREHFGVGRVGKLSDIRKEQAKELERNPGLKQRLFDLTEAEVGGEGPGGKRAFMETVFNRAAARGQTLAEAIHDHHYYPPTTTRKVGGSRGPKEEDILADVLAGSNVSNYATGNASGSVRFAGGPQTARGRLERFGIEGPDVGWANRMGAGGSHGPGGGVGGTSGSVKIPSSGGNTSNLTPNFKSRLNAMYDAMPENLRRHLSVRSGWRSHAHQAALYAASDRSGRMVAHPGGSQHEYGNAVDLSFGGSDEAKRWVHSHAHEYGLKFPMPYEDWHIEPQETRGGAAFKGQLRDRPDWALYPVKHAGEGAHENLRKKLEEIVPGARLEETALHSAQPYPRAYLGHRDRPEPEHHGGGGRFYDPNIPTMLGRHTDEHWTDRITKDMYGGGKVELPDRGYRGDPDINKDSGGVGLEQYNMDKGFDRLHGYTQKEGETLQAPYSTVEPGTKIDPPSRSRHPHRHTHRGHRRRLRGPED